MHDPDFVRAVLRATVVRTERALAHAAHRVTAVSSVGRSVRADRRAFRVHNASQEDYMFIKGMNRLRAAYLDIGTRTPVS